MAEGLAKELERFVQTPRVTVIVSQANSARFFAIGQVVKSGEYPLARRMTVLQGLALAGGFKDFAKTDSVVIVRLEDGPAGPGHTFIPFNYKRVEDGKDASQNLLLKAGDTILVP